MSPFGCAHNPFSTRHTGPDGTSYLFPPGQTIEAFADAIAAEEWRAELVGPHGAGKSTLLRTLFAEVERRDLPTVLFSFNDQRRRLPFGWRRCIARGGVCFLDGGEVLPAFALRRLDRATHRHGCGLIVTTHAPLGIAPAHQVTPDPETFALLVSNLLIDTQYVVSDEHAMQILLAHGGDAREALWALYDEFESFAVE